MDYTCWKIVHLVLNWHSDPDELMEKTNDWTLVLICVPRLLPDAAVLHSGLDAETYQCLCSGQQQHWIYQTTHAAASGDELVNTEVFFADFMLSAEVTAVVKTPNEEWFHKTSEQAVLNLIPLILLVSSGVKHHRPAWNINTSTATAIHRHQSPHWIFKSCPSVSWYSLNPLPTL